MIGWGGETHLHFKLTICFLQKKRMKWKRNAASEFATDRDRRQKSREWVK